MLVHTSAPAANRGPDFLIIGARRAGAAWLARTLSRHPDVWTPPIGEIHYFDRSPRYPTSNRLADPRPWRRLTARTRSARENRRELVKNLSWDLLHKDRERLRWDAKFFFGRCDDAWYASLFDERFERVVGEATSGYAMLEIGDVEKVRRAFPSVKILYILRDPVERSWSELRAHYDGRANLDAVRFDAMRDFFESEAHRRNCDYVGALERWGRVFPPQQIRVLFYEKLVESPDAFVAEACEFLEVDPARRPALSEKPDPAAAPKPPAAIERYLCEIHHDRVTKLSRRFGGPVEVWQKNILAMLDHA